ncbi:SRPBCC domain-containing protein [Flexivirga alba]|uniref:SRPBCC domain-containing protein n=1 Tax=Flexivirga alba TaxID=702742 RepID=A0ABW2ABR2_9MICO
MAGFTATAAADVAATAQQVWAALTEPDQIATYLAGSRVTTTWEVGSPITWDGEYDGHSYQDKGDVLTYDEPRVVVVHPLQPDNGPARRAGQLPHPGLHARPRQRVAPTSSSPRTAARARNRPRSSADSGKRC